MTTGIDDATALIEALRRHRWADFSAALSEYSASRVPEGVAMTELNYVYQVFGNPLFVLQNAFRRYLGGKDFSSSIADPGVKFSQILKE